MFVSFSSSDRVCPEHVIQLKALEQAGKDLELRLFCHPPVLEVNMLSKYCEITSLFVCVFSLNNFPSLVRQVPYVRLSPQTRF